MAAQKELNSYLILLKYSRSFSLSSDTVHKNVWVCVWVGGGCACVCVWVGGGCACVCVRVCGCEASIGSFT